MIYSTLLPPFHPPFTQATAAKNFTFPKTIFDPCTNEKKSPPPLWKKWCPCVPVGPTSGAPAGPALERGEGSSGHCLHIRKGREDWEEEEDGEETTCPFIIDLLSFPSLSFLCERERRGGRISTSSFTNCTEKEKPPLISPPVIGLANFDIVLLYALRRCSSSRS